MKLKLLIFAMLIALGAKAQNWSNFNPYGTQWKITGLDTTFRLVGSAAGKYIYPLTKGSANKLYGLNFSNGLTKTDNNVTLGGPFTSFLLGTINTATNFTMNGSLINLSNYNNPDFKTISLLTSSQAQLGAYRANNSFHGINVSPFDLVVNDAYSKKGLRGFEAFFRNYNPLTDSLYYAQYGGVKKLIDSASISAGTSYIKNNNTGTPQSASFNINGIGRFDSPTATTLFSPGIGSFATEAGVTSINGGSVNAGVSLGIGSVYNDRPVAGDPAHILNILNDNAAALYGIQITSYGNSSMNFHTRKANGTYASPTALVNGDAILSWGGRGFNGLAFSQSCAAIVASASENWTPTANGTRIVFSVQQNGTAYPTSRINSLVLQNSGAADFISDISAGGAISSSSFIIADGIIRARDNFRAEAGYQLINKTSSGWLDFATRNTTGSEAVLDLTNVGSITAISLLGTGDRTIAADATGKLKIADPSIMKWQGESIATSSKAVGDVISYNGTNWINKAITTTSPLSWNASTSNMSINLSAYQTTANLSGSIAPSTTLYPSNTAVINYLTANYAKQGGNSFASDMVIGTNDANDVSIVRNGFEVLKLSTTATFNVPIIASATGFTDSGFINTVQSETLTSNVNTNYPSYGGTLATVPTIGGTAPTPTGTGKKGQVIITGGYRYECTATNTWIRSAIETTW